MNLRVPLLAATLLFPFALETVHGLTASGDRHHPPVVLIQLAAAEAGGVPAMASETIANPLLADIGVHPPAANISATRRYEILVRHSAWFRDLRLGLECGSIDADALKTTCRDSFGALEAMPAEKIRAALAER